jgi:hypothetical protein
MSINPKNLLKNLSVLEKVFLAMTEETGLLDSDHPVYRQIEEALDNLRKMAVRELPPQERVANKDKILTFPGRPSQL